MSLPPFDKGAHPALVGQQTATTLTGGTVRVGMMGVSQLTGSVRWGGVVRSPGPSNASPGATALVNVSGCHAGLLVCLLVAGIFLLPPVTSLSTRYGKTPRGAVACFAQRRKCDSPRSGPSFKPPDGSQGLQPPPLTIDPSLHSTQMSSSRVGCWGRGAAAPADAAPRA